MTRLYKFLFCLLLCVGGGWLSGLLTQQGVREWYPHLIKSAGTPPNIVFPLVWTLLYFMMSLALYLLWVSPTPDKKGAYCAFGIQLFLNFVWSGIFFYFQSPGLGLVDMGFLWVAILTAIVVIRQHSHLAAYLLIPYLAWVSYAAYLNLFIWWYN